MDTTIIHSGLYPQTLFHFTEFKEALWGILEENFKITYSEERLTAVLPGGKKEHRIFGVPQVSFCDLRLSELRVHMKHYGLYGIGMKKEWAQRKRLNTVYYASMEADFLGHYLTSLVPLHSAVWNSANSSLQKPYADFMELLRFTKNYEGALWRQGKLVDLNFRFANEREWRYVLPANEISYPFGPTDKMNPIGKSYLNSLISGHRLHFDPDDINYIIVEHESERDAIIEHIKYSKGKKYPKEAVKRLQSRILTAEQIALDV